MLITFILDPLKKLHKDDGTLALARAAHEKGHDVVLVEAEDMFYENEKVLAAHYKFPNMKKNTVPLRVASGDVVMMRVDPPFNMNYIYLTYMLDQLQRESPKLRILNPPNVLRDWNEKMSILKFPKLIPPTLIAKKTDEILNFSRYFRHGVILKPLNQKGGSGIEWLKPTDTHGEKLKKIEKLTHKEKELIMVQEYLEEASKGDKRISVVNGKIVNCILRVPRKGDFRGNISKGATPYPGKPTEKELKAVKEISKILKKEGVFFAGLDFIGERLTEINVTSPIIGLTIFPETPKKIIQEL